MLIVAGLALVALVDDGLRGGVGEALARGDLLRSRLSPRARPTASAGAMVLMIA